MSATKIEIEFENLAEPYDDHNYWLCTLKQGNVQASGASYMRSIARQRAQKNFDAVSQQKGITPTTPNYENSEIAYLAGN